jgi:peptidoglycan/xylan/chitin deacetylase (PgdA/CDA1 family)
VLRVVLYHHLSAQAHPLLDGLGVTTPPRLFEDHLLRLERSYEVVDLEDVLSGRLPERALLITFDDGYRSVLDVAAPIMRHRGLPGVVFVSERFLEAGELPVDNLLCWLSHQIGVAALETAVFERPATGLDLGGLIGSLAGLPLKRRLALGASLAERFEVDCGRLREDSGLFLEPDQVRSLAGSRLEVGNHTRSHVHCRAVVSEEDAAAELVDHRRRLEQLAGAPVRSFSYPYGSRHDATPFVEGALAASGHEARFLVEARPNGTSAAWHRVSLQDTPASRLHVKLEVLPRLREIRDRLPVPPRLRSAA